MGVPLFRDCPLRRRGATWEGDELVTYVMESLVWQMEHMGDDYMIDND